MMQINKYKNNINNIYALPQYSTIHPVFVRDLVEEKIAYK